MIDSILRIGYGIMGLVCLIFSGFEKDPILSINYVQMGFILLVLLEVKDINKET